MSSFLSVLTLRKGEEWFVFVFTDETRTQTLRMFGRFAAEPQLNFSWYDSAVLAKKVRETAVGTYDEEYRAGPLPAQTPEPNRSFKPKPR